MSIETDEVLIRLVQGGGPGADSAFDALYHRYATTLYRYCHQFARNSDEAADIAQEVWLKVYDNIDKLKEPTAFRRWLYRIATNASLDHRRRRSLEPLEASALLMGEHAGESSYESAQIVESPEFIVQQKVREDEVNQALTALPEMQRTILIARIYRGLSTSEIANMLNLSHAKVSNSLEQAQKSLHDEFMKRGLLQHKTKG